MLEQEYIDATNLAKVRIIRTILVDTLCMRGEEQAWCDAAMAPLTRWMHHLERLVSAQPPP
jgi:hypothetical protein